MFSHLSFFIYVRVSQRGPSQSLPFSLSFFFIKNPISMLMLLNLEAQKLNLVKMHQIIPNRLAEY